MRWTAPAAGIAMCNIQVAVAELPESAYGYKCPCSGDGNLVRCSPSSGPSRLELPLSPTTGMNWPARVGPVLTLSGPRATRGFELEKHPDKTLIGRIEKGFDFLGYHFGPDGLGVARATIEKFIKRASRLYEQERERPDGPSALGMYVRRWKGWVKGGLKDLRACEAVFPASAHPDPCQTD